MANARTFLKQPMRSNCRQIAVAILVFLAVLGPGAVCFELRMSLRPLLRILQRLRGGVSFTSGSDKRRGVCPSSFSLAQDGVALSAGKFLTTMQERQIFESSSFSSSLQSMRQTLVKVSCTSEVC